MTGAEDVPTIVSASLAGTQASIAHRRTALLWCGFLVVSAAVAMPFLRIGLAQFPAIQTIAITATLCFWSLATYFVFAQAVVARNRPLLSLAAGCLFSALMSLPYLLTFPGIFGSQGVFGSAGAAAWLWWFAHLGFVLFAVAYAVVQHAAFLPWRRREAQSYALAVAGTAVLLTILTTLAGPVRTLGAAPSVLLVLVCAAALSCCFAVTRARTPLDLWLIATILALLCDSAVTAFGGAIYTVGWYLGRLDNVLAAAMLPAVFLFDVTMLSGRLAQMAALDTVSGLGNRRALDERLQAYVGRRRRRGDSLSVIMLDIDHFKAFNDLYGHAAGDECLRSVGDIIRRSLVRGGDFAARYGGEEFVIVLPSTHRTGALVVAERLRSEVERLSVVGARSSSPVTISLGVVTIPAQGSITADRILGAADRALYAAKAAGRNCIMEAGSLGRTASVL